MARTFLPLVFGLTTVLLLALSEPARSSTAPKAAKPTSPPTGARTPAPTPTPNPASRAKDQLKSDVEAAFAKAKSSLAFQNNSRESELLQQRVDVFMKWLSASESDQEAQGLEAKRIIEECNRMSNQPTPQPKFWSSLFGTSVLDYLARAAVVIIALLLVVIIFITASLNKNLWSTIDAVKGRMDRLEKLPTGTPPQAPEYSERPKVLDDPAVEKIREQIQSAKTEVLGSLEQLRQSLPPPQSPPSAAEIPDPPAPDRHEDMRELAQNKYVNDVLRKIPEDRQVTTRYYEGHSSFRPDSSGELIVVLNDDASNLGIILPKTGWLNSADQFYMHYQQAYACERPGVGSMFILSPAVVEKDSDGWKLAKRGNLDLRS